MGPAQQTQPMVDAASSLCPFTFGQRGWEDQTGVSTEVRSGPMAGDTFTGPPGRGPQLMTPGPPGGGVQPPAQGHSQSVDVFTWGQPGARTGRWRMCKETSLGRPLCQLKWFLSASGPGLFSFTSGAGHWIEDRHVEPTWLPKLPRELGGSAAWFTCS